MLDDVTNHASDSPLLSAIDSDAATGGSPGDVSPAMPAAGVNDDEADVNDATPAATAAPVVERSRADVLKAKAAELSETIAMIGNPYAERDALNQKIRAEIDGLKRHTESATTAINRMRDRFREIEYQAGQTADVLRVARDELAKVEAELADLHGAK